MAYEFYWNDFNEAMYAECGRKSQIDYYADWCVGNIRVGEICFDLVFRSFDESKPLTLTYDAYVGGVDDGYGYSECGYPYTEADGGTLCDFYDYSYEVFKEMAEAELTEFIEARNLTEKASEELNLW